MRFAPPVTKTKTATSTSQSQSVWTLEGDHSLESVKVTRDQLLAPEQGETGPPPEGLETGPPPEDLKSHKEGLPVKTQWMTSWNSHPQVGEGT